MTVHVVERTQGVFAKKVCVPAGVFVEIRDHLRGVLARFDVRGKAEGRSLASAIERTYLQHPRFVHD